MNRLPTYMRPIRPVALEEASEIAIEGMIEHLQGRYRASRAEAIALASIGANLRITQIVSAVVGVHTLLSPAL